jgi:hypothetical protein
MEKLELDIKPDMGMMHVSRSPKQLFGYRTATATIGVSEWIG